MPKNRAARRIGPIRDRRFEQLPKPPGRSLMSVRGDAAPRGMTAHDRIRLTGPFAEYPVFDGLLSRREPTTAPAG